MEKIDLKKLKKICQPKNITSRGVEHWFGPYYRKISLYITWILIHFKTLTPNTITTFGVLLGSLGGFLILIPNYLGIILFFLAFQLWALLDYVDGEVARATNRKSLSGPYIDLLGHFTIYFGIFTPIGLKINYLLNDYLFIILGLFLTFLGILIHIPEIAMNVILYKEKKEILFKGTEKSDNPIIAIYRALIGPIEISIITITLLLISPKLSVHNQSNLWLIFFGFYIFLFISSFLLSIYRSKKELDNTHI
jgi:phosphatidylglycerophosphate synthase